MTARIRGVIAACCVAPFLWACGGSSDDAAEPASGGDQGGGAAPATNPYQAEFNAMDANGDGEVTPAEYNAYRNE